MLAAVAGATLLASCSGPLEVPPRPPASNDRLTRETSYPNLYEVPPRPDLPDTVQARQRAAGHLEGELSTLQYRGALSRYEAGLLADPPQRSVARNAAAMPSPRPHNPNRRDRQSPSAAERYVTETVFRETNDGDLADFLDGLERSNLAVRRAVPRNEPPPAGPNQPIGKADNQ